MFYVRFRLPKIGTVQLGDGHDPTPTEALQKGVAALRRTRLPKGFTLVALGALAGLGTIIASSAMGVSVADGVKYTLISFSGTSFLGALALAPKNKEKEA